MNPATMPLESMLRRLHLANAPRIYRALCEQAEREHWSYHDFLAMLVAEEIAHRQQTRLQRLARKARFPFIKTIEEFDFTLQSTVRQSLIGSYLTADFVTEGRCLVRSGRTGRGKTHQAIAIAYRAIQNGFDALFCTAAAAGKLRERLHDYVSPDVLVIDEVGYLSHGPAAASVLFHVVNERHQKRRAMLFTTNKPTTDWGNVLHDHDLADVIVDRVLERGRVLKPDGPSYRTRHLSHDGQPQVGVSTKLARISGIQPAGFLEPQQILLTRPLILRMDNLFWLMLALLVAGEYGPGLPGVALLAAPTAAGRFGHGYQPFRSPRKSGHHQTEIAGNHAPKRLETLLRNGWSAWAERRSCTTF